jgi:hypothetical protein
VIPTGLWSFSPGRTAKLNSWTRKFFGRDERNFSRATAVFSISRYHLRQRRNQT